MILSAIAAMDESRAIGFESHLPWDIPEDLEFFRRKTSGHILIMGRKTFDSLGRLLPKRHHVVITRDLTFQKEGVATFASTERALEHCQQLIEARTWPEEVFVAGGAEIYSLFLPSTSKIYLTEIHERFSGDTFFPIFDKTEFQEVAREKRESSTGVDFDFVTYQRRMLIA